MFRMITAAALVAGGLAVAAPAQADTAYMACEQTLSQVSKGDTPREVRDVFKHRGHTVARDRGVSTRSYSCPGGMTATVTFVRTSHWHVAGSVLGGRGVR